MKQEINELQKIYNKYNYDLHYINELNENYDYELLSENPNIDWNFILQYKNKPWNYDNLSLNPNITWEIVKNNSDKAWNYIKLSKNKNITWDIVNNNPNPNANPDNEMNGNNTWDFNLLSENPNITWEIVKNNPDKQWNYNNLITNSNITLKIIEDNPNPNPNNINERWNINYLSLNSNIKWIDIVNNNFIRGYQTEKSQWNYYLFSKNPNITWDVIENNPNPCSTFNYNINDKNKPNIGDNYNFNIENSLNKWKENININIRKWYEYDNNEYDTWNYNELARNPNIDTIKLIKYIYPIIDELYKEYKDKYRNKKLNKIKYEEIKNKYKLFCYYITINPYTTLDIIIDNPNINWNYNELLSNPNISWYMVKNNLNKLNNIKFNFIYFGLNPNITLDIFDEILLKLNYNYNLLKNDLVNKYNILQIKLNINDIEDDYKYDNNIKNKLNEKYLIIKNKIDELTNKYKKNKSNSILKKKIISSQIELKTKSKNIKYKLNKINNKLDNYNNKLKFFNNKLDEYNNMLDKIDDEYDENRILLFNLISNNLFYYNPIYKHPKYKRKIVDFIIDKINRINNKSTNSKDLIKLPEEILYKIYNMYINKNI
jgi:hypothetical protein